MRIGISTSVIQRGKTGVAQYVFSLVRGLAACAGKHEIILFVLEEDLPLFQFAASVMTLVPVSEKHRPAEKNVLWHQTELPKLVLKHKLDVLHIPSYRRLLWSRPCALVATIHDLAPFKVSGKYDWKRMFYGKVVVRQLAKRQDEIIAISQNTAQDITKYFGLPPQRLTIIPNGLDHERFFPGPPEGARTLISHRYGIKEPFFLYVARLEHPGKNHVRLLHAFNLLKMQTQTPWKLVFAGSDWHGAEEIHATIRQLPCAHDVHCLGFVAENDLSTLYRAASTFIYPSLYEGFGMPPVEAMACGCPVISSTRGALAEVIGQAAHIVDPDNTLDMMDAMKRVSEDPALREQLRGAGLIQSRLYAWERTVQDTLQVYEKAARLRTLRPVVTSPEEPTRLPFSAKVSRWF